MVCDTCIFNGLNCLASRLLMLYLRLPLRVWPQIKLEGRTWCLRCLGMEIFPGSTSRNLPCGTSGVRLWCCSRRTWSTTQRQYPWFWSMMGHCPVRWILTSLTRITCSNSNQWRAPMQSWMTIMKVWYLIIYITVKLLISNDGRFWDDIPYFYFLFYVERRWLSIKMDLSLFCFCAFQTPNAHTLHQL